MPWQTLDIAPTADEREIRRAYARQLKSRQHEEDAEFFSRLRWAYETALVLARAREDVSEDEQVEVPTESFEPSSMEETENSKEAKDTFFFQEQIPSPVPESLPLPEPLPEFPTDETGYSPKAQDTSNSQNETPEDLLRDLEDILEKEGLSDEYHLVEYGPILDSNFTLQPHNEEKLSEYQFAQSLCMKWEMLQIHPQLENLAEREAFSERLAILLAGHWPISAILWPRARDFFAWRPPAFSDVSPFGQALNFLFDMEAPESVPVKDPESVPVERTWKDYWQKYKDSICLPYMLLIFLLHLSKSVFGERPAPEPAVSFWQVIMDFLSALYESTKFALRFLLGLALLFLEYLMIILLLFSLVSQGPEFATKFFNLLIFLFLVHLLVVYLLPGIHETEAFKTHLLRYRTVTARFFVIYLWVVLLFLPTAIAIHQVLR
jgi:hypothetical protein